QFAWVDARRFMSLARSAGSDGLAQAAELWQGTFLPDLALDIEAFDTWHRQEADRLSAVAADVFEALCRNADANGDGNRAIAAAERLVALEPTREDRQRTALVLFARYKGPEAALSRARQLTDLLRSELGVPAEAATRALIDAIKRGDFEPAHACAACDAERCQTGRPAGQGGAFAAVREGGFGPRTGHAYRRTNASQCRVGHPAVLASPAACRRMRDHCLPRDRHGRRAGGRKYTEIMVAADRPAAEPSACGSALCRR